MQKSQTRHDLNNDAVNEVTEILKLQLTKCGSYKQMGYTTEMELTKQKVLIYSKLKSYRTQR